MVSNAGRENPARSQQRVDLRGDAHLLTARLDQGENLGSHLRQHRSGSAQSRQLLGILDHARPFDHLLGRNEAHGGPGRISRAQQPVQAIEAAQRHDRRFDADGPELIAGDGAGGRFFEAAGCQLDLQPAQLAGGGQPIARAGDVAAVHDQSRPRRRQEQHAHAAAKPGQIAQIGRVRDDERVEAHLGDGAPDHRRAPRIGRFCAGVGGQVV